MNRILLTALASVALCFVSTSITFGAVTSVDTQSASHHHGHQHKVHSKKSSAEMIKEGEDRLGKIKDGGTSLPAEMKAEFDYNLEIAAIEIKALKDENHRDPHKHFVSLIRHVEGAEQIVKKHVHMLEHAKKVEERNAKAEARKARAAEREAKAAERRAERAAAKIKREAEKNEKVVAQQEKAHEKAHEKALIKAQEKDFAKEEKSGDMDHGRSEGVSKDAPGSDAAKTLTEEKK